MGQKSWKNMVAAWAQEAGLNGGKRAEKPWNLFFNTNDMVGALVISVVRGRL